MSKKIFRDFNNGLLVTPTPDRLPEGTLARARGISGFKHSYLRSRRGSATIHSLNAHSIHYFASHWYYGVSTTFYYDTTSKKTGLSGNRLSFVEMSPTAGITPYLFVAGGGSLFKCDSSGNVTNWGIEVPAETAATADGGSGSLDDGAVYKYRFTYYNTTTGTRSNPTSEPTSTLDSYTVLLLHCDGADASPTFTDTSGRHTMTAQNHAQLDTAYYKFGTASGLFDGTDDYLTSADHADWCLGSEPFTIDFWLKCASVSTPFKYGICGQYVDANNYWSLTVGDDGGTPVRNNNIYLHSKSGGTTTISVLCSWTPSTSWMHIAIVRVDATSFKIFIDGVLQTTNIITNGAFADFTTDFTLGRAWFVDYGTPAQAYLNGWIDEFRISKGIARWTDSFSPPTAAYAAAYIDLTTGQTAVALTGLPVSSDSQVSHLEIWRTVGDGTAYFLATRVANGTTSYTDKISDLDLGTEELPEDNYLPSTWFDNCLGNYNASMFWITRTQTGQKGRVFYSPIGRAEAQQGYINVTTDGEPLQKLVRFGTGLGVFSNRGFYEILGSNPYYAILIPGVPGTTEPHSVVETPFGIVYRASDGIRLLTGRQAILISADRLDPIFSSEAIQNLTAFSTPALATFARNDEYIITDTAQTLALNLRSNTWRDLGLAVNGLYYEPSNDKLALTVSSKVLEAEKAAATDDAGTAISYAVEPAHFRLYAEHAQPEYGIVQRVYIDANTGNQAMTVTLVYDGGTTMTLGTLQNSSRALVCFPANRKAFLAGVRITGSITAAVHIYSIEVEYSEAKPGGR